MAEEIKPTKITKQQFTGDVLLRSYNIFRNEITGDYFFDYVEFPDGFDLNTLKFFRVEAKSAAEVEAAVRTVAFGDEAATAENNSSSVAATIGENNIDANENENTRSTTGTVGEGNNENENGRSTAGTVGEGNNENENGRSTAGTVGEGNNENENARSTAGTVGEGNNENENGRSTAGTVGEESGARVGIVEGPLGAASGFSSSVSGLAAASGIAPPPAPTSSTNVNELDGGKRRTRKLKRKH